MPISILKSTSLEQSNLTSKSSHAFEHWLILGDKFQLYPQLRSVMLTSLNELMEAQAHLKWDLGKSDLARFMTALLQTQPRDGKRYAAKRLVDLAADKVASRIIGWIFTHPNFQKKDLNSNIFEQALRWGGPEVIEKIWAMPQAPNFTELQKVKSNSWGYKTPTPIDELVESGHLEAMKFFTDKGAIWKDLPNILLKATHSKTVEFLIKEGCPTQLLHSTSSSTSKETLEGFWRSQAKAGNLRQKEVDGMIEALSRHLGNKNPETEVLFFKHMWSMGSSPFKRQTKQLNLDPDSDSFRVKAWQALLYLYTSENTLKGRSFAMATRWAKEHKLLDEDMSIDGKTPLWIPFLLLNHKSFLSQQIMPEGGLDFKIKGKWLNNHQNYGPLGSIKKNWMTFFEPLIPFKNNLSFSGHALLQGLIGQIKNDTDRAFLLTKILQLGARVWIDGDPYSEKLSPLALWKKTFDQCSDEALLEYKNLFIEHSTHLWQGIIQQITWFSRSSIEGIDKDPGKQEWMPDRLVRLGLLPETVSPDFLEMLDTLDHTQSETNIRWTRACIECNCGSQGNLLKTPKSRL